jgi:ABC-type multidrug transport system fused ATPase/permease subunit
MNPSGTNRFFSKLRSTRNNWAYVLFTIYFCILLSYFLVFPALTSTTTVDAQLFSGQRRNDTTTPTTVTTSTPSSSDGLLSILRDPGILTANLSSSIERVVDVVEERIDSRLQAIKTRLDEVAAVAIPAIIAAVAGIVVLAALIVAFIIFYWINRFREGRRHKRNTVHLSEHVLQELKENGQLLNSVSSSSSSSDNRNSDDNNLSVQTEELSNSALKAAISSPFFWDVPSNAQYSMLKLDVAIDRYNSALEHSTELRESAILNKIDEQTASKVSRGYDAKIADYRQETIDLSNQLRGLMEVKETTKRGGAGDIFKSKSKAAKK